MTTTIPLTTEGAQKAFRDASFPAPFVSGLEYGPPARGPWNIVHTGMLVPESHQVFVCAQGCLRGVVLTAAEMGAMDRFHTVAIREENVTDGVLEDFLIEGVADLVRRIEPKPRAVLVYTSCIHHFTGCDLNLVFRELRRRFPEIDFTDCYMTPILRKTLSMDALMRRQLYSLLKPSARQEKTVNFIGDNVAHSDSCDLVAMLRAGGWTIRDIRYCRSYDEYQQMATSAVNISTNVFGRVAGETLEKRLGQRFFYLPVSYEYDEIRSELQTLARELSLPLPDLQQAEARAEAALAATQALYGDTPLTVDVTATQRPLSLTKLLLQHGFNVVTVYGDSFNREDKPAFDWLRANAPDLTVSATVQAKMGLLPHTMAQQYDGRLVAVGQKGAWFTGTSYFVNLLEDGGEWGFDGIVNLCRMLAEALAAPKNTREIIQVKGWGCCC